MIFRWNLFLISYLYFTISDANQELGQSPDLIFGTRTMYVTPPTPIVTADFPFVFEESGRSLNKKKWEITYLSREDARKLISESKERQRERSSTERKRPPKPPRGSGPGGRAVARPPNRRPFSPGRFKSTNGNNSVEKKASKMPPVALPLKYSEGQLQKESLKLEEDEQNKPNRSDGQETSSKSAEGVVRQASTSSTTSLTSKDDESTFVPTEGLEAISSTSDDRMALLKDKQREVPQLIFLADDPEAASRIPELLTTLYDVGATTRNAKPSFYGNIPGIITERNQDQVDEFTDDPQSVQLTSVITTDRKESDRERTLDGPLDRQSYFPNRHRPSYTNYRPPPPKSKGQSPGGLTMTRVMNIEAECQDDYMRIQIRFNGSFEGLVYSSGYSHDLDCVYINGSGRNVYEFYIKLNRCGTLGSNQLEDGGKPMHKNVMWNTLTVQYNPLIEEEWDEHFKVTCEYGLEIWKTVTFPFLDVEVQTGNPMMFTLSPPECHMEIRLGFGPDGPRVTSPVRVGDHLTLVIYMRSQYDGFDIVISDCFAHNGGAKTIVLIDSYGCPVDDKLISHFEGESLRDGVFETQVYAFMKTFRFTGSPALYIECGVRMCHGDCPAQRCHWRRSRAPLKKKTRRSVSQDVATTISTTAAPAEANVSESVHLFQALQVVRDEAQSMPSSPSVNIDEEFCFKPNHFGIGTGVVAGLLTLLTSICFILCLRLRRLRKSSNSPRPPQAPINHTYKSEFVPPNKRRLE